jgi:hypothetical protein
MERKLAAILAAKVVDCIQFMGGASPVQRKRFSNE